MTERTANFPLAKYLIPLGAVICAAPFVSSGMALLLGIVITLALGNPHLERTKKLTHSLLGLSVMGLGAGMNLNVVGKVGAQGIGYTIIGISSTLLVGTLFGRFLKTTKDCSLLITAGTAICGGSAIAALAPTIRAKAHDVSVALGTVFILNAAALFLFPWIGHMLNMTQEQFGLWSALAIHDTSSVVGAALQYGPKAVEIGTTIKLARALWIVPLTFAVGYLYSRDKTREAATAKPKRPWFILGFLIAAALVTWVPALAEAGHVVEWVARRALVITLFLIGSNLTRATLKSVGVKPFIQGVGLWILAAAGTLEAILAGWIHV